MHYCMEQEKEIASKHAEQLYEGFESERIQPEKCCFCSEVSDKIMHSICTQVFVQHLLAVTA